MSSPLRSQLHSRWLKFSGQLQLGAMAREFTQVQRARIFQVTTCHLRVPRRLQERLARELDVESWSYVNGVTGELREIKAVIVAQVPKLRSDEHLRNDAVGERTRKTDRRFALDFAFARAGPFRLIHEIKAGKETIG